MSKKSLFEYASQQDYSADEFGRPADASSVSLVAQEIEYDGKNIILDALPQNCEVGDMLVYDVQENLHKILKMSTFVASSFDTQRYLRSNMLWHRNVGRTGLFLHIGQASRAWGAQTEYVLSGLDLTQAGSFDILSTGYQAKATATTISWEANATLASIITQLATGNGAVMGSGSYSSRVAEGDNIVFMIGGTGTNLLTISNLTGGAENAVLTDYSKHCKIGDVELEEEGDIIHRSFQGSLVTTCFPSLSGKTLAAITATYTKMNVSRGYYAGCYFPKFKAWAGSSGSDTFVDDTATGSVKPMKKAVFEACKTSQVEAERACYERNNGNWDTYLRNSMAYIESLMGSVNRCYKNFGKQGEILGSIFYKNRNDVWTPCYPAAYYAATQMGVDTELPAAFAKGKLHLIDNYEMVSAFEEGTVEVLNQYIALLGGTALGGSYLWSSLECYARDSWYFRTGYGTLGSSGKMSSGGVRGGLAFEF